MKEQLVEFPKKLSKIQRGLIIFGIILISILTIIWTGLLILVLVSIKDKGLFNNLNFLAEFLYMVVAPIPICLFAIYKLIISLKN